MHFRCRSHPRCTVPPEQAERGLLNYLCFWQWQSSGTGGEVRPFTRSSGTLTQPASSATLRVSWPQHIFLKWKRNSSSSTNPHVGSVFRVETQWSTVHLWLCVCPIITSFLPTNSTPRDSGDLSCGIEEFCILVCNDCETAEWFRLFRGNVSTPSSRFRGLWRILTMKA